MKEPVRWRDEDSDEARALLRHAPKLRDFTPEDRARTRARVARLAAIAAVGGGLTLVQSAALGAGLAVASIAAYTFVPAWISPPSPSTPPPRIVTSGPASRTGSAAPVPSAVLIELPRAVASTAPSSSAAPAPLRSAPRAPDSPSSPDEDFPLTPPARVPDSLAQEAVLIEQARAALATSPADALRRAEEHATQFPAGKLSMEREIVAIDALGRLGRSAEARARGEALLARARGGLYEARLQKLLDGLR